MFGGVGATGKPGLLAIIAGKRLWKIGIFRKQWQAAQALAR